MLLLLAVSLFWAFSFGLLKGLSGLDPSDVSAVRLALSLAVFAPFARITPVGPAAALRLGLVGAVQFGAMYLFYIRSFAHLQAYQVALFTITTPLWVAFLDGALQRRWRRAFLTAAALSVAGAAVLLWRSAGDAAATSGFVMVQLSNVCFAAGQVAWRIEKARLPQGTPESSVFAFLLAGALAVALAASAAGGGWSGFHPTPGQWATLAYLGAVASGLGFFLWNRGAARVNAGVLAAFNNAKIPLGVACSLLVFGERADPVRLVAGSALMGLGVWVAARPPTETGAPTPAGRSRT